MLNFSFIAARKTPWDIIGENFTLLAISLLAFGAVLVLLFLLAGRASVKAQEWLKYLVFLVPALLLLLIGLIYPTIRTIILSFMDAKSENFVGFDNYVWAFTIPEILIVLRNTAIWVFLVPFLATTTGLAIAYMTDRMKRPAIIKSLIFMPMAISFVGASVIWRFVYYFEPNENRPDLGLFSTIVKAFGGTPPNWLLEAPGNTFLLIAVMVWIQTGFAMVVLSAAMKNVPEEIIEAAMLDGASPMNRFFRVTVPLIRATLIVVLTTIIIATLKVFDIVRTMTGGNFQTNVIANEMYSQAFRQMNYGTGSALAIILFVAIIPVILYNVKQLRLERTER
ncbi:carbohydrate ABC transporter permease [Candidatus Aquiluna sp. UB-MaderosW2red]|jgi:alpha-glucoside transport system permease protein|uniref:carbohydrate ABC transporter permease n=1 Tax=Candidatus Aquiluna sp. UB-MaderosW2red TaxID=1855377 RepID=UPI000875BBAB|nr:sugar ABC transporter permease [Candidatus Aquiluna sp. UB-MaderosW2red]SCX05362.1 alpha-glucoside transport system permease protein [Candidatus Aquiluna sp. UB-MaderosW2red]